ncbi:hypothetical protein L210DRAFT_3502463 [Boletus edulis BED1]|uniref:Uncharacterized protein n=1 Tax=Boletus edulis BED1 TaxID=1328754 RepID=A0AAD4BYL2_BOLED|nr:hypothetical protein L210DRAFT_3502463 [Boletus edulis BED1]
MSGSDEAVRGKPNQLGKARWMRGGGQEEDEGEASESRDSVDGRRAGYHMSWPALQVWSVLEVGGAVACEGMVRSRSSKAGWQQPDGGGGSMHECFVHVQQPSPLQFVNPGPQLFANPNGIVPRWSERTNDHIHGCIDIAARSVHHLCWRTERQGIGNVVCTIKWFQGPPSDHARRYTRYPVPKFGRDVAVNEQDAEEGDVVEEDRETLAVEVAGQSESEMEEDMEDSE